MIESEILKIIHHDHRFNYNEDINKTPSPITYHLYDESC